MGIEFMLLLFSDLMFGLKIQSFTKRAQIAAHYQVWRYVECKNGGEPLKEDIF